MEILIREADLTIDDDASSVVDVLDSYARDPVGGGTALSTEVRKRLVGELRNHPLALVLLAFGAGTAVGLAICFFGLSTFRAQPLLNIHDLAVLPGYRGRGVGRALLTAAERHAVDRGCCKLTLEVQDDNRPARRLYQRFGFEDFVMGNSAPTRFLSKSLTAEDV